MRLLRRIPTRCYFPRSPSLHMSCPSNSATAAAWSGTGAISCTKTSGRASSIRPLTSRFALEGHSDYVRDALELHDGGC